MIGSNASSRIEALPFAVHNIPPGPCVLYENLINFERCKNKSLGVRCVMCGEEHSTNIGIPLQNKDVCRACDKGLWLHHSSHTYFKWCKGCKNFRNIVDFVGNITAAKCSKCLVRAKLRYGARKAFENAQCQVSEKSAELKEGKFPQNFKYKSTYSNADKTDEAKLRVRNN